MLIKKTQLIGCYEITPSIFCDERGSFVKTFHNESFIEYQLETNFVEQYYSVSHQGVLRGMHFQVPPKEHVKLVYCIKGEILDAVVDLRIGSPTYGRFQVFNISSENQKMIYIPDGMAHGFFVTSNTAIVVCSLSSIFSTEHDGGIRWDTIGIPWPDCTPIISEKDRNLPKFSEFNSPFYYVEKGNNVFPITFNEDD